MKDFKIYLDMDGTLVDFVKQFKNYSGGIDPTVYENEHGKNSLFTDIINKEGKNWWATMPWLKNGKSLYNELMKKYPNNLYVLTAPTPEKSCVEGKKEWVSKNLKIPPNKVILDKEKYKYDNEWSILIDDMPKYRKMFKRGIALDANDNYKKILKNVDAIYDNYEKVNENLITFQAYVNCGF